MSKQSIIPLQDASVLYKNLTLKPYPRFELTGDPTTCAQAVTELLESKDVFALIWRGKIRESVLQSLKRYEARHAALALLLAQSDPYRFADWTDWCPALIQILLHWTCDDIDGWKLTPAEAVELFTNRWQDLLAAADFPPTKAFLRLLSNIPLDEATFENLTLLKQAFAFPRKAKLASHLKLLNSAVIDTLQLPYRYLSVDLLERAATKPLPPGIESVRQMCLNIVDYRVRDTNEINWPFQGARVSLAHLAAYLEKLQLKMMNRTLDVAFSIPPPPVAGVTKDIFDVRPLRTVGEVFTESNVMQNCLQCYARKIADGDYYAYKLLRPERATILLVRNDDLWVPVQIRTAQNGFAKPETIEAIESWLGEKFNEMEGDGPF